MTVWLLEEVKQVEVYPTESLGNAGEVHCLKSGLVNAPNGVRNGPSESQ